MTEAQSFKAQPPPTPSSSSPSKNVHSNALAQLSTQLISTGFLRHPLPPTTFNGGSIEGQELLLKSIWSLLGSRSKEMAIRESLMAKQREILYEQSRIEGFLARCEKQKLEAQQESTASANRANAAQKELELERNKHRKTREDFNKLKNAERLIRTTSVHELRRKTNELSELQRRLTKLSDPKELQPSRLILGGHAVTGSRVQTDAGGRIGLLEFDLEASRQSTDQLRTENQQLRSYLDLYERQILNLITEIDGSTLDSLNLNELDCSNQKENQFITISKSMTPLSTIYKRLSVVTYKLRDKVFELSTALDESKAKLSQTQDIFGEEKVRLQSEHEKQCKSLEFEIERLQGSLKEAETMLESWAQAGLRNQNFDEMGEVTVEHSLEIGRSLQMQAEALKVERQRFTEEAIQLGRQRAELEMRKLDEERRKILEELETDEPPKLSPPEPSTQEKTLDSLVIYTQPATTAKKPEPRTGKVKSSVSKALTAANIVKHKPMVSSSVSRPGVRGRTAVLKSLLSVTGEEQKVENNTQPVARSSPRLKRLGSDLTRGRSTTYRGQRRLNNAIPRSNTSRSVRPTGNTSKT